MLIVVITLLLIFMQEVTGIEEVNPATDYNGCSGASSGLSPYANYSDFSFYHELANLTSNGLINISTDNMMLSST